MILFQGPGGSVLLNGTPASFDRCVFYRSYSRSVSQSAIRLVQPIGVVMSVLLLSRTSLSFQYDGAVAQVVSLSTPLLHTKFSHCDLIENKAGVCSAMYALSFSMSVIPIRVFFPFRHYTGSRRQHCSDSLYWFRRGK